MQKLIRYATIDNEFEYMIKNILYQDLHVATILSKTYIDTFL